MNGEPQVAIQAIETAIRLSPNDPWLHFWLGTLSAVHYAAQDYESAVKFGQLAVQRNPRYPIGHRSLANALAQTGRLDEAREVLARFLELSPKYSTEIARRTVPFRHDADFQHYMAGLRKIGFDR
jgi:tetratricopeptide (TPR) repeat protein